MLEGPDGYVYQLISPEQADKRSFLDTLEDTEKLVYQCIERSGGQGIWIRDIKTQTSLHNVYILFHIFNSRK